MNDFRCEQCGKLLCREDILFGQIEVKCNRCGWMNEFKYKLSEAFSSLV